MLPRSDICTIVLAAGQGRRYREELPDDKLLAPCLTDDESCRSILEATLNAVRDVADRTLLVVAADEPERCRRAAALAVDGRLDVLTIASQGLGETLAQAVRHAPVRRGWLIVLGDMPYLQTQTCHRLVDLLEPTTLALPLHCGRRGHPRAIGSSYGAALARLRGDEGAGWLFVGPNVVEAAVDDPGVLIDIDRPADRLARPLPPCNATGRSRRTFRDTRLS